MQDKIYYYLILFSIVLISFSFISLLVEVNTVKVTNNIPYIFIIFFIISYSILIAITIIKKYIIHTIFYALILLCLIILIILKYKFDQTNISFDYMS